MTLILRGRKFGFALEDIRQWLLIYEREGTEAQMRRWVELADRQLEQLESEKAQLDETMAELRDLRDRDRRDAVLTAQRPAPSRPTPPFGRLRATESCAFSEARLS